MDLFECTRLHARISERQCKLNRNGFKSKGVEYPSHISCQGCAGLGKPAQVPLPSAREEKEKKKMSKKGTCKVCEKKDTHIIGAGMCWTCRKEAMEAGTYPEPASILPVKPEPVQEASEASHEVPVGEGPVTSPFTSDTVDEKHQEPPKSGLQTLLRIPPPVPEGIFIPLNRAEIINLVKHGVGADDLRELVRMLLNGELMRVEVA